MQLKKVLKKDVLYIDLISPDLTLLNLSLLKYIIKQ